MILLKINGAGRNPKSTTNQSSANLNESFFVSNKPTSNKTSAKKHVLRKIEWRVHEDENKRISSKSLILLSTRHNNVN